MYNINKRISVKQLLSLNISFLFVFHPLMAADIVVDATRTHQNTSLDRAANGTSVVNISTPNTNGVSHNTYIQFNVPTQGTILNNADREVQTQLAGYIYGNENVRHGSASLILNEVSGTNRSRLNGYLEVAGQSADVIVANPNGITVNGAGFINIPKATLTTGKVSFTGNRPIFDIEGGDIFIDGKGLDARGTSSLDLYTQAIKLNAKLHANDLRVVTGLNHIDENGKVTSRDAEEKERAAFSIDSTVLGGIYANAISLVGTQKGVGVNLPSEMLVQDRLEISADGKIVLGKVSVKNDANIRSNSSTIEISEGVHANTLELDAATNITLRGNTGATKDITLLGDSLDNEGVLAAGVNADFTQAAQGTLDLELAQNITNEGVLYGLDAINMDSKSFTNNHDAQLITQTLTLNAAQILDNAGELRANHTELNTQTLTNTGFIHAKDSLGITADSVNNSDGNIEGLDTVTLHITNDFVNNNGTLFTQKNLLLQSGTLEGIEGNIVSEDRADIIVSGLMNIEGGYLESNGLRVHARGIQANSADLLSYDDLDIITQDMRANASSVQVVGDINIKVTNSFTQNNNALLYATGNIDLETQTFNHTDQSTVQSDGDTAIRATSLNNTGSTIVANSVEITAQTVNNTDGALQGSSDVRVNTDTLNNTRGALQANGNVNITATGNVDNTEGTIYSGEGTIVTANEVNNEDGFIGSVKAVFLDLFGLSGDNGTVSGDGVTIHTATVNSNNAMIQSTDRLDIVASSDVTLSNSAILSNGELKLTAEDTTLNGSTLYSGHDNINVNAATLDAQNAYIEANQALVFNASKDIYVSGSTIKGNTVEVNTVQNMIADGTNIVAGDDLGIDADNLAHSNGQLIATNDLDVSLTGTLTQNNSAFIAYHNTELTADNHTLSGASTLYAANVLTLNIAQTLNHTDTSRIISDNLMTINAQALSLNNASLFAQNTGVVNTTRINNTEGTVSGTEMNINTVTFNNANSHFYSDDGIVNITTTGALNNHNGLMSANGNLMLHAQNLDNRNGDLEAGNTLDVTSNNLQIDTSRFFAGKHLALTSNISNIDAGTQFLSSNSMDLDFSGNLINHGEITSNNVYGGETNIMVHGDVSNYSTVTANGSLSLSAHTLNNNTGARIRGGGDTAIILSGDLNNHHFMTSSQNLEVTAQNINNYAGIAADEILTLNSINLYNYNTLLSGIDMNLYVTNLLRNHEDAAIYAGRDLTIAANTGTGKTNKIENISAKIESHRDMRITAKDISNISAAEITTTLQTINGIIDIKCDSWGSFSCPEQNIALEIDLMAIKTEIIQENADKGITLTQNQLQTLLTEEMIKRDTGAFVLNMYKDTKTTSNELYFYELTASLTGNEMIVKRTKPHKKEEYRAVTYSVTKEIVDAGSLADHKEGKILSGHNLTLNATTITNKTSLISASNDIHITADTLNNIGVGTNESIDATINYHWKRNSDGGKGSLPVSKHDEHETGGVPSQILAGGAITGNIDTLQNGIQSHTSVDASTGAGHISTATPTTNESQNTVTGTDNSVNPDEVDGQTNTIETTAPYAVETLPLAVTPQIYDPSTQGITLPNNPYGLFIANPDLDGPLIESNPEYTNYNNFVSSDYMLERLGYDGSSQMRRLGDAMYETQLIRDAIIAMTGQRYIGTAQNDNDQYIHLMNAGVNYAQEVGLQLGVAPTSTQLKDLKDDLVWMEVKTVEGKEVLVPVLYLAKEYTKPTGANINANSMDLTVDGHLMNSGNIQSREDMTLRTGTFTNAKGNIEAGSHMNISAIGDLKNLSAKIKGGSVVLSSTEGSIINKTLSKEIEIKHSVGREEFTMIDKTASIEATKGHLVLDAGNQIENIGADLSAKSSVQLKAKENINIKTVKDERSYDYTFSNGYAKGESVEHLQSTVKSDGQLSVLSDKNINLEAITIKAADTYINAKEKVNLTAVVDSKFTESHFENDGFLSSSTESDMKLAQSVKGTEIQTANLVVEGDQGVSLESVTGNASNSTQITSKTGDVDFTAKAYTNASFHEESSSTLGGLMHERSVDSVSATLLADSSTKAENNIIVDGKNINLVATNLESINGGIKLAATDNVNIISGLEASSEEHTREESGLSLGYSSGRFTFAKETIDSIKSTSYTNKASSIKANRLVIESGQDTNVIASNITAGEMRVDVGRDFNVLSDKDITTNNEEHSTKEIGVEFTLTSKEASVFAGYWEDQEGISSTQNEVVSSNINAGSLEINSQNTNVLGSNIAGENIAINSENIRILSDSSNTNVDTYTKSIKAGVEIAARQNLSNVVDAVAEVGDAQSGSAAVARGLRAYDSVQTFAEQPVTAGVTALYEESSTDTHSANNQVVGSSVTATNSLTLNATNELEIAGSDVGSANDLAVNANNINIHASQGSYTTQTESKTKNASVGLYGTNMGQATVGYQENEMTTEGIIQRNSQLYAGGTANITSTGDTTLSGANIEARNLALNVAGDLNMQSLQDTQSIEGSSRGGSISGNVMMGVPTGASANAGETTGEKAWVSQVTGINGAESVRVNVGGTTTLTGASITNLNADGEEQGNLEVNTQHLVVSDIKDIDTYDASTAGIGLNNGEGNTPSLNSVEYTNNTRDIEQITRATIGSGSINAGSIRGTVNRDVSNIQEVTRDESSSVEVYVSDRSLALLDDPTGEINTLKENLKDIGLDARVEILENLPTSNGKTIINAEGKEVNVREDGTKKNTLENIIDDTIGKGLDTLGDAGILPSVGNSGGYVTQIATQLFGDNRAGIIVENESKMKELGLDERQPGDKPTDWDYERVTFVKTEDGIKPISEVENTEGLEQITRYRTNPDKQLVIGDPTDRSGNPSLEEYKIRISEQDIEDSDIGHLFTNGMFNNPDTAMFNQQTQQNGADAVLNYNQMHGVLGDMMENVQDHLSINGLDMLTEVITLGKAEGSVDGIGYLGTGGSRQTGKLINQMSTIRQGDLTIGAHSQGTLMTQNGLEQHQENLGKIVQGNTGSNFLLQYSGAPVNHVITEQTMTDIYGGEKALVDRTGDDGITNVFRSQVAPEDFVGSVLGYQSAGINNSENLGANMKESTLSTGRLFGVGGGSTHSYYGCVIGCGNENSTPENLLYINPDKQSEFRELPIQNYYETNFVQKDDQGNIIKDKYGNNKIDVNLDLYPSIMQGTNVNMKTETILDITGDQR